jgi:hypothetical protein
MIGVCIDITSNWRIVRVLTCTPRSHCLRVGVMRAPFTSNLFGTIVGVCRSSAADSSKKSLASDRTRLVARVDASNTICDKMR